MADKEYIYDFISGEKIAATPEELDSVQVFSKMLVYDYGYPKELIQTRPQFRVKARPSDTKKNYPVDIAIFQSQEKREDDLYIIVECKKRTRRDGLSQLQDYLRFSRAQLGVWFNGSEKLFLRKLESDGRIDFKEIPNIPKYGQRIEDIGKFLRRDLKPAVNLKSIFKTMRNYLAQSVVGATRDEVLAQQLINLMFCKIYDEKFTKPSDMVTFRAGINEPLDIISKRINNLFKSVKSRYDDVIDVSDEITLDDNSLMYVVGELQLYSLTESPRDAIGDAFEVFIGHALKGGQGQFFTPRNVIQMVVEMLEPTVNDLIFDPACGSGGFLVEALRHIWNNIENEGKRLNWPQHEIEIEKQKIAIRNFRGIDKDYFLSKVSKAYMALIGDGRGGIFCENSLDKPENWHKKTQNEVRLESFNIVMTNPPFGSKIRVEGEEILQQYEFGHQWSFNKKTVNWEKGKLKNAVAPQILFIERCLQFLSPGGKLGIVLPDGILGNDKLGYIRSHILQSAKILAIVDVPIETFMPHTSTKTTIMLLEKNKTLNESDKDYDVFMAIANTCGHNRRGDLLEDDDILAIPELYRQWKGQRNGQDI